jgi:hypothetical protein
MIVSECVCDMFQHIFTSAPLRHHTHTHTHIHTHTRTHTQHTTTNSKRKFLTLKECLELKCPLELDLDVRDLPMMYLMDQVSVYMCVCMCVYE